MKKVKLYNQNACIDSDLQEWHIFKQCCLDLAPAWAIFNRAEQAATFTHLVIWQPYCTVALMWFSGIDLDNPL